MDSRVGSGSASTLHHRRGTSWASSSAGSARVGSRPLSLTLLCALLLLCCAPSRVLAQKFPYTPTQILAPSLCLEASSCDARDVVYVFSPGTGGGDSAKLLALTLSKPVDDETALTTISDDLPFLEDSTDTTTFTAVRTVNGTLQVYAGDCHGDKGDVWTYDHIKEGGKDGTWTKQDIKVNHDEKDDASRGPYFLGGLMAFSATLAPETSDPTLYTYGGMCASPTDSEDWQSNGNYTKSMISLKPEEDNDEEHSYSLSLASSLGPKTPIAGFSMTSLTPGTTNISGVVTQQVSYVVLGGHTQQAFINMSTAAVWSLPEEIWSYVAILPPGQRGPTELAVKDSVAALGSVKRSTTDNVYSRSGHTAVLTEDGHSLVVMGGWVGDVDTPAEPQLAILDVSQAFSGWQWSIPEEQPDDGLYGHGAAILPGNVMMIHGGWKTGSASLTKRQALGNSSPQFLNLTSMKWSTTYKNPDPEASSNRQHDAPGGKDHSGKSKDLGLGLGLGLGLPFLLCIIIAAVFFCYQRRRSTKRQSQDAAVKSLSQDASHFLGHHEETSEQDDIFPWPNTGWYTGGHDPYGQGVHTMGYESMRGASGPGQDSTHAAVGIVRKPVPRGNRGGYVPPGVYPSHPGQIHPIMEDDEDEQLTTAIPGRAEVQTPVSEVGSDPFATPSALVAPQAYFPPPQRSVGSRTPSPEHPKQAPAYDPAVQDWKSDVDAAEGMLTMMNTRQGRLSPTRRNSHRSGKSHLSGAALRDDESRSGSNLSDASFRRSASQRKPFFSLGPGEHPKPGSSSSSSYNTARSHFGALQAEGPSLLLGRTTPVSPGYDEAEDHMRQPSSPSKSKPSRRGWLGSLRRVFSISESTSPASTTSQLSPRRASLEMAQADYEAPPLVGLRGELLRRKQGRQDWNEKEAAKSAATGDQEWDIERAVEQRLVQVMFTVPKERLRVVNADERDINDDESFVQPQTAQLVDPERESHDVDRLEAARADMASSSSHQHQPSRQAQATHEEVDEDSHQRHHHSALVEPLNLKHHHRYQDQQDASDKQYHPVIVPSDVMTPPPSQSPQQHRQAAQPHVDPDGLSLLGVDDHSFERRLSHSSQVSYLSSAAVMQAEVMTMQRPKTKVLRMVDSIESQKTSPAGSPRP